MKKTLKLMLVMALVVVMALSLVACGGNNQSTTSKVEQVPYNETGLPIFDEMQTITLVSEDGNSSLKDIQEAYNFTYYKTKAKIDFRITNGRPMATKILLLMATDTLPDLIWRTRLSYANFTKYCLEGDYFLDFQPYMDAGKMPGLEQFASMISGDYLRLCRSINTGELNGFLKSNLQTLGGGNIANNYTADWNMAWLDAAGATVPYSNAELWDTLAKVKATYGASSESLIIASSNKNMQTGLHLFLARGYGFQNYLACRIVVGDDGGYQAFYENEAALNNFRSLMKDYYKLYVEGYVDPYFDTRTDAEVKDLATQNKVGFIHDYIANDAINNPDTFATYTAAGGTYTFAVGHNLPQDKKNLEYYDVSPTDTGEVWGCVKRDSKFADGLVRFFDWHFAEFAATGKDGYDSELCLLTNMMVDGFNCNKDEDGNWTFEDFMPAEFAGDEWGFQRSQFIPELFLFAHTYSGDWYDSQNDTTGKFTVATMQDYRSDLYQKEGYEWDRNNVKKMAISLNAKEKGIKLVTDPALVRGTAEQKALTTIRADMNNFLNVWVIQFAKGQKNPSDDATWNEFLTDLKKVDMSLLCISENKVAKQNNQELVPYSSVWG